MKFSKLLFLVELTETCPTLQSLITCFHLEIRLNDYQTNRSFHYYEKD